MFSFSFFLNTIFFVRNYERNTRLRIYQGVVRDKAGIAQDRQVKSKVRDKRRRKMFLDEIKYSIKIAIKHCSTSHEKRCRISNSPLFSQSSSHLYTRYTYVRVGIFMHA